VLGKLEAAAHQVRASYLAAPVFGRPDAAQAATLVQVLGGENAAKELIKPLIVSAIARRVVDAGEDVAKGMTSHAAWKEADTGRVILGVVEMLAETYALTDAIGFDPEVYQNFIRELFASSWQR
jgi:3-hydroxyisobutyrate dehydrogenase-like beta-hydroxyacid dehydrogenase